MEYSRGALMIFAGLVREGVECFESARAAIDGERRNPWDEPECGHHYARAMSAWSGMLAYSGFRYDGPRQSVALAPAAARPDFRCFWATATGWGTFSRQETAGRVAFRLRVDHGALPARRFELNAPGKSVRATLGGVALPSALEAGAAHVAVRLEQPLTLREGQELRLEVLA